MEQILHKFYDYLINIDFFRELIVEEEVKNLELDQVYEKKQEQISTNQIIDVPLEFLDLVDYIKVWEPLFYIESKANILKCITQESSKSYECKISGLKVTEDYGYLDLYVENASNVFYAHDLVLFSCQQIDLPTQPEKYVPHTIGIVESTDQTNRDNLERINDFKVEVRNNLKGVNYIMKLCPLSTIEREYKALHSVNHFNLKKVLLHPREQLERKIDYFTIPDKLEQQLRNIFNGSQFLAIKATLKTEGITLIQGPPGTGKTQTVLGTVSVLLQSLEKQMNYLKQSDMEIEDDQFKNISKEETSPWIKPDYVDWRDHIFDEVYNDINKYFGFQCYSKASNTDNYITKMKSDNSAYKCPEKVLICGPSNASVDEIIKKVLEGGLLDENGNRYQPFIVRIGDNYDKAIAHVSLDNIVQQRMFEQKISNDQDGVIRNQILKQAKIIFGTLSSTGSQILLGCKQQFDTVIIDEAAQAVEISTLIPLEYGCKRLILIGDPNQLPATIFSKLSEKHRYSISLFERLQKNGLPSHLLNTQYRMHPTISKFISTTFYKSEILDYEKINELIGQPDIYSTFAFDKFVVFDVKVYINSQSFKKGYEEFFKNSYRNDAETQVVTQLVGNLLSKYPKYDLSRIGIVSPYSQQIASLSRSIKKALGVYELPLEIKTVDGFQGGEKDIIIFSTVRSRYIGDGKINPTKTIGFLKDVRRMNVSLSRCRLCLIVVCDINKLKINKIWRQLIEYSFQLGTCYKVWTQDIENWMKEYEANPLRFQVKEFKAKKQMKGKLGQQQIEEVTLQQ